MIPIKNLKCLKNTKSHFGDSAPPKIGVSLMLIAEHISPGRDDWRVWMIKFLVCISCKDGTVQASLELPVSVKVNSLSAEYWLELIYIAASTGHAVQDNGHCSFHIFAHAFFAPLRHFKFLIGIIQVPRGNGLKNLIPKHLWKSKIRRLEQI